MAVDKLAYKKIEHTIDADFGVEQVFESPFILHDDTAKKFVSYITQYNLLSNKLLRGYGDSSWNGIRRGDIITITVPRFNITTVTYIVCEINSNLQGKYNFVLRPYDADLYSDVALSASTAWTPTSGYGNIYEVPYVTVSPTVGEGMFTTIEGALANLPGWARRIVLLRGTHTVSAGNVLTMPTTKGIDIIGECKDDVIVQNASGQHLFVIYNSTKKYKIANFTIDSQNVASGTNMIYVYGSAAANNTSELMVDSIGFNFSHENDRAVRTYLGQDGYVRVQNLTINDSTSAEILSFEDYENISLLNSILREGGGGVCVNVISCSDVNIIGNRVFYDLEAITIYTSERVAVSDNFLLSPSGGYRGIRLYNSSYGVVKGNNIRHEGAQTNATYSIDLTGSNYFNVANNIIYHDNADTSAHHYGIKMSGAAYNVISENFIDMVNALNSTYKDYGVVLWASSDYNRGHDNIAINCGVAKSDTSTGNDVYVNGA